jgi:transposase
MSFAKAQDLLRLAQMAASRRGGVSLEDICAEFDVSHRTAQRMTEALEATYVNVSTTDDAERRRYRRMDAPLPDRLLPRQETAIEALETVACTARDEGRIWHSRALEDLRDGFLARLKPRDAPLSAPFPPPMLALNVGARTTLVSITDPSSLIGMTTVENTALSKWTIELYQFTKSCIV